MNTGRYTITKVIVTDSIAITHIDVHSNPKEDLEHTSKAEMNNMILEQALGLNDPYKAVLEGNFHDICFYGSTPTNYSVLKDLFETEEYCTDDYLYEVSYAYPLKLRKDLLNGRVYISSYSPMYYEFSTVL